MLKKRRQRKKKGVHNTTIGSPTETTTTQHGMTKIKFTMYLEQEMMIIKTTITAIMNLKRKLKTKVVRHKQNK